VPLQDLLGQKVISHCVTLAGKVARQGGWTFFTKST
jgi:hypothetical protein